MMKHIDEVLRRGARVKVQTEAVVEARELLGKWVEAGERWTKVSRDEFDKAVECSRPAAENIAASAAKVTVRSEWLDGRFLHFADDGRVAVVLLDDGRLLAVNPAKGGVVFALSDRQRWVWRRVSIERDRKAPTRLVATVETGREGEVRGEGWGDLETLCHGLLDKAAPRDVGVCGAVPFERCGKSELAGVLDVLLGRRLRVAGTHVVLVDEGGAAYGDAQLRRVFSDNGKRAVAVWRDGRDLKRLKKLGLRTGLEVVVKRYDGGAPWE